MKILKNISKIHMGEHYFNKNQKIQFIKFFKKSKNQTFMYSDLIFLFYYFYYLSFYFLYLFTAIRKMKIIIIYLSSNTMKLLAFLGLATLVAAADECPHNL